MPQNSDLIQYILLSEHQCIRESVGFLLQHAGYPCAACASPAEFPILTTAKKSVLLIDLSAPHDRSLQVQRTVTKNCPSVNTIFLSDVTDVDVLVRAFGLGAVDYIFKPFTKSALVSAVRRAASMSKEKVMRRPELRSLKDSLDPVQYLLIKQLFAGTRRRSIAKSLDFKADEFDAGIAKLCSQFRAESVCDLITQVLRAHRVKLNRNGALDWSEPSTRTGKRFRAQGMLESRQRL